MPVHPRSLANLKPGNKATPEQRKAHSVRMNNARKDAQRLKLEAKAASLPGVLAFRYGYRLGHNAAYLRWKAYAEKRIQEAYRGRG